MPTSLSELEAQRERLKRQLTDLGDLRPGKPGGTLPQVR